MTFSMVGRCARTGMLGAIVTTSSIAVGSRCPYARAKVGAVLTQHRTDPTLGPTGLELLAKGMSAQETVDALVKSTPHHGWRQLAVIDAKGRTAHFSGKNITSVHAGITGKDCVAVANIVRTTDVPKAMVSAFEADPALPLATRLCRALHAGEDAGGEPNPVTSAALLVVHEQSFPYVDLRVDDHPEPIIEIERLWGLYEPKAAEYVIRACDPDRAQGAS
ncbi:MAG: DUF1028 domain-containing protein [Alphaproteobacteria bacterium]|nr:DUF1028 domain-containing protein [Alphaproteobacteria bacterium]